MNTRPSQSLNSNVRSHLGVDAQILIEEFQAGGTSQSGSSTIYGMGGVQTQMRSNNTLERTVICRGRIVLAMDGVLADAQWRLWPAAQRDR